MKSGIRIVIAAVLLALVLNGAALSERQMTYDGIVKAKGAVSITAPIGGEAGDESWLAGQRIEKGDIVLTLLPEIVTASESGTVRGIFASAGDSADVCVNRYGAVLYIETDRTYTLSASTEKGYDSDENKFIHTGETVYLSSISNAKQVGKGVITQVNGSEYTVEVREGEFVISDTVNIFRSEDRESKSRIGRGTVQRVNPTAYTSTGSIYRMLVKEGQHVAAGEALYETLSGTYDGYYSTGNTVVSDISGIVESVGYTAGNPVNKGDSVLNVYPDGSMYIEITIQEIDLAGICEGDPVQIEFMWNEGEAEMIPGVVSFISMISSSQTGEAAYTARVDFEADASVRLGMTAIVYTVDEASEDAEDIPEDAEE
ncbi:MAG: HlyD family efflux transporter periplasmic adaptor subunit [Clostridia bacterium]|nr:HlyD family efflux transporter periplasmic adaptor subunit [Clostridia bacterium]